MGITDVGDGTLIERFSVVPSDCDGAPAEEFFERARNVFDRSFLSVGAAFVHFRFYIFGIEGAVGIRKDIFDCLMKRYSERNFGCWDLSGHIYHPPKEQPSEYRGKILVCQYVLTS